MIWLVALAIALALGFAAIRLWLPQDGRAPWTLALHAALGAGFGLGITSCLYFLLVIGGMAKVPVILGVELAALAAASAMLMRRRNSQGESLAAAPAFAWNWVTALGLAVMLVLFSAGFLSVTGANPQGGWDAFAIWNLRAHYLLHTETWKYAATPLPVGTHMEYPLLLSGAVARAWQIAGDNGSGAPAAIALLFSLSLAALLVAGLTRLRAASLGLLAGVILLANPELWNQAPAQYADLPLAFYALASLVLLSREPTTRDLSLAGIFAGLATWTKNEGMLVLIALVAALFVSALRSAGVPIAVRRCATFLLGALPVLALTLWFKIVIAPPDPLAGKLMASLSEKLFTGGRWVQAAGGFLEHAWLLAIPLALLALAAGLLRLRDTRILLPWLAVLTMLAGYFVIFLLTPDDLGWLLATALDRLYLQLWPLLVFAALLSLRKPEDFVISVPVPKGRRR